jgi:hypothetical protein
MLIKFASISWGDFYIYSTYHLQQCLGVKTGLSAKYQDFSYSKMFMNTDAEVHE